MTDQNDIYVYIVDGLPLSVSEAICPCGAFSYTLYINGRLSQERQREAYFHALRHIERGDWEREDVQLIEKEAHG